VTPWFPAALAVWEIDTRLFDRRANDATFGRPYRQYRYQGYEIMVGRKNLLSQLGSPPPAG
jgi:hypothetical protein